MTNRQSIYMFEESSAELNWSMPREEQLIDLLLDSVCGLCITWTQIDKVGI